MTMNPTTTQPTDRTRLVLRYIGACLALQEPASAAQRRRAVLRYIDACLALFETRRAA